MSLLKDFVRGKTPLQRKWAAGLWQRGLHAQPSSGAGLVVFAIPLVSRRRASDWERVSSNLARTLASEFALETHSRMDEALLLSVSDLDSIERMIEVRRYLESLNVVENVRVALIRQDVVTYRLKLRNDPEDLQRLIEFGDKLEQEDFPQLDTESGDRIILNYSYIDRGASN